MNYYEHHLGDYMRDTAHLSILEDGVYRRLIDAYYIKEEPLPLDRKKCWKLVRAQSKAERDAVDSILEEFFDEEEDGFHHKRCDEEIAKYLAKKPQQEEKRENDKERQRRARERRKQLFTELSGHGIHMPWNTTTEQLQTELSRVTSQAGHAPVTEPVTRDNTATQTPIPSHQSPVVLDTGLDNLTMGGSPSLTAGEVCKELVGMGMMCNPGHPKLIELVNSGATLDEFIGAATDAKAKGKFNFDYMMGIVANRRIEAKNLNLHKGPLPSKTNLSSKNQQAVQNFLDEGGQHAVN